MKNSINLLVRVALCMLPSLPIAIAPARAEDPCNITITSAVTAAVYQHTPYGDFYRVEYTLHVTGVDPCGEPAEEDMNGAIYFSGDPDRSCTAHTAENVRILLIGDVWCVHCPAIDQTVCCEIPESERYLDATLYWPPIRAESWMLRDIGPSDIDPDCDRFQLQYYGFNQLPSSGVRMDGQLMANGAVLEPVTLQSNLGAWDSIDLCFPEEPCTLLALPFDVSSACAEGFGARTQGILCGRSGDDSSCPGDWIREARLAPGVRAISINAADGTQATTLTRAVPAGIDSVHWTVCRTGSPVSEPLVDGPQPNGAVVTGAGTSTLTIANATASDLGVYTFWGIPIGGSASDTIAIDTMRIVAAVGQPEFVEEPHPTDVGPFEAAVFGASTAQPSSRTWRANQMPLHDASQSAEGSGTLWIDGWWLQVNGAADGAASVQPLWFVGGDSDLQITCEAWNNQGGVMSYQAPLQVRSFPAQLDWQRSPSPRIGVWTASQYGGNTYHLTVETSVDLGQHWNTVQTPIVHAAPGEMYSVVPVQWEYPCAAIVLIRATVSDGVTEVGSLSQRFEMPRVGLSDCSPDSVDFTDFRCPLCPPDAHVTLDAPPGEPNPPFSFTYTLPPGNWQTRWVWMTLPVPHPQFEPILDGPTGRGGSSASGSSTASLTIHEPSWDDLGTYAFLVRNMDDPSAPEFCADIVTAVYDECGTRVYSSPGSVALCPGNWTFPITATTSLPGDQLQLRIDEWFWLSVSTDPLSYAFDDPNIEGDAVSFTIRALSGTDFEVTDYTAEGNHTFSGYIYNNSTACSGWYGWAPLNPMVVWHVTEGCGSTCPSDLDASGEIDFGDVALVLLDFGPCSGCPTDRDGTDEVDFGDVALVLLDFGVCF